MKKYHIIVLLFLGVIFTPGSVFACGKEPAKHSDKTECSSNKSKKECSCCNKKDKGCKGGCSNSKCGCPSTVNTTLLMSEFFENSQNNNFNFSIFEKVKFPYSSTSVSDGFYSIWLIPKIG